MNASVTGASRLAHAAGTLAQPSEGLRFTSAVQGVHVQMLPIKGHNKIDAQSLRRFRWCIKGFVAGRKELKCRRLQLRFYEGRAEMPSATGLVRGTPKSKNPTWKSRSWGPQSPKPKCARLWNYNVAALVTTVANHTLLYNRGERYVLIIARLGDKIFI